MTTATTLKADYFTLPDGDTFILNLHGAKIPGASLPDTMLNYADFSNCYLFEADFSGASLINANFASSFLANATFRNANLSGADFTAADLTNADLRGADLNSALFNYSTKIFGALVDGVDLRDVVGLQAYEFISTRFDENTKIPRALAIELNEKIKEAVESSEPSYYLQRINPESITHVDAVLSSALNE
jgi:uncharacterized protein YjbI with pentapeptide repeats